MGNEYWSGSPAKEAPDTWWEDDDTGEYVNAASGERMSAKEGRRCIRDEKSLSHARRIAGEKASFEQADPSVDKAYSGKVMGVTDHHVVLSLGRTALIVAQSDLDRVPAKDEEVVVTFKDGKGTVQPGKERGVGNSR